MPAFRATHTVEAAARTVLDQDYPNLVLGIGVRPDDIETIAAIRRVNDPRIILLEQLGIGISDGRNVILRSVEADLYMFLDADDYMKPGVVSAYVRHRVETGIPALRCGDYVRGTLGEVETFQLRKTPFRGRVRAAFGRLCVLNFVSTGSVALDREIIQRVGYFDERFNHGEDWHYWLRVARVYPLFVLDVVAYHYTYAKLARAKPFPRSFFEDGIAVIRDIAPAFWLRFLSETCLHALYAVYYMRTLKGRQWASDYLDIRFIDFLSLMPASLLLALRRLGV